MTIYLAGAIRDKTPYDLEWRDYATRQLVAGGAAVLNPLSGQYETTQDGWFFNGVPAASRTMVARDLYQLRKADCVLANLLPMADGYRSIGTLLELGVALERRQLVVLVGPPEVTGHPFLTELAYATFTDLDTALQFLTREAFSLRRG